MMMTVEKYENETIKIATHPSGRLFLDYRDALSEDFH